MSRPCLLHSRQYRAVYEGMLNSLSPIVSCHTLSSIRSLQVGELCTCAGPLPTSPLDAPETPAEDASPAQELPAPSDIDIQQASPSCSAVNVMSEEGFTSVRRRRPQNGAAASTRAAAQPLLQAATLQLEHLAGRRSQLDELRPAIARLETLLQRALAVRPSEKKEKEKKKKKPKSPKPQAPNTAGGRAADTREEEEALSVRMPGKAAWRRLAQRRYGRRRFVPPPPPRPPSPPPRPYAPLRWPPLAVTVGVLKGRLAPATAPARPALQEQDEGPYMPYLDEDVLDIAERFEAKLELGRGSRRGRESSGGGGGGGDGLTDPKYGPTGLRRGRWTSGPEATVLLQKRAALEERRQRKAALSHAEARRDSHRCFRAGKDAAPVADLWPYK